MKTRPAGLTDTWLGVVADARTQPGDYRITLDWWTIDGGGEMWTSGGDFELSGTIGQPDAGTMIGGDFELTGGFWAVGIAPPACPGGLDGDGDTDLADLGILLADFGCAAPGPCVGDLDGDGDTDLADLGILLANFGEGCAP